MENTTRNDLRYELFIIARKILRYKGLDTFVTSTKVDLPGTIIFKLRGGSEKSFEIIDNMVYENSRPCIKVEALN